jgi:LEA14-like dessication related protein
MRVRSTLFGSRRRVAAVVLVAFVLVAGAAVALGVFGTPSVTGVENRFGGVNETATVVESNLTVTNPNPFGASAGGLTADYVVEMNDIRMAQGTKTGVSLPAGQSDLPFTTLLANERIPAWWVSHIRGGEQTTLTVAADVHSSTVGASFDAPQVTRSVDTDLLSQFNSTEPRPVDADSALVSDPVLYVNETRASWGTVANETTELDLAFVVYNPKPYPVGMTQIGYDVSMNDVTLGEGRSQREVIIPPGETRTVETTTRIRNGNLDEWWVTHIERNQVSELRIDFSARLDLRATTVEVPLSALTYTKTVETDIFGTKPDTAATPTGTDDGNGDGATEPPSTDATETARSRPPTSEPTATPTPTPTPTATPTPTDDDGLLGGDDGTTPTPTDDGGLLGDVGVRGGVR